MADDTESPTIGHNLEKDLPTVDKIVADLELANAEALARTAALLAKGREFLEISDDKQDSDATEFMVKLRARYKQSEADRIAAKSPFDDRAGAVHAFFKTKILDLLGLAPSKASEEFDPMERADLGMGPRINMAQTLYKRKKVEIERRAREEEARLAREREAEAKRIRDAETARLAEEDRQRRTVAAAAEAKARREAEEAAAAASRKRNADSKAAADAAAEAARRAADEARKKREEDDARAEADRAAREEANRAEENRLAEERARREQAAAASASDLSRERGGKGGVSSLRTFITHRDVDRERLDYAKLGPYFKDAHIEYAINAFKDANKATVQAGIKSGNQPIAGVVYYESDKNAGRA